LFSQYVECNRLSIEWCEYFSDIANKIEVDFYVKISFIKSI